MGYSDAGELLLFQGGDDEMVVRRMYGGLNKVQRGNLSICCYIAKDQIMSVYNKFKARRWHSKSIIAFCILHATLELTPQPQSTSHSSPRTPASKEPATKTHSQGSIPEKQIHDRLSPTM